MICRFAGKIIPRVTSVFFYGGVCMEENKRLVQLLGRDKESRDFFASLSPELRRLLMKADISNFKMLHRAASESGRQTYAAGDMTDGQTASATESTGSFTQGDDISGEKWKDIVGR